MEKSDLENDLDFLQDGDGEEDTETLPLIPKASSEVTPYERDTMLTDLVNAYLVGRGTSFDKAKLYHSLVEKAAMSLDEINAWLMTQNVSPDDQSTISRHVAAYRFWLERNLRKEVWERVGPHKLLLLAHAAVPLGQEDHWLALAFNKSYRELKAMLDEGKVKRSLSKSIRISTNMLDRWEEVRTRLRKVIPEFDVPGVKLDDETMVDYFVRLVLDQPDMAILFSLHQASKHTDTAIQGQMEFSHN
jgi:hypothetical protein